MSSLGMVAYINSTRKPELEHFNFLVKVPTVLKDHLKFQTPYLHSWNRSQPCYNLPEQESMFMAMSYSTELLQTDYRA